MSQNTYPRRFHPHSPNIFPVRHRNSTRLKPQATAQDRNEIH